MIENEDRVPIGVGHTSYNAPRWLRRQVLFKHRHECAFPGCEMRRHLHLHHMTPWPLGPTDLDNLIPLCPFHHKLVHEYRWRIDLDPAGAPRWFRQDGSRFDPRVRLKARAPSGYLSACDREERLT